MRRNLKLLSPLLACVWLESAPVFALTGDTEQPIRIKADTAELNDKTGVSVYRGNVRITQGSIVVEARTVRIVAPQKEVEKIIAEGDLATFRQKTDDGGEFYGEGEHLEYLMPTDKLILLRRARVLDGDNTFASERIEYNRKSRVVEAGDPKGGSRVDMTIIPKREAETTPAGQEPKPQ